MESCFVFVFLMRFKGKDELCQMLLIGQVDRLMTNRSLH